MQKKWLTLQKLFLARQKKGIAGKNLVVENGDLVTAVENLKRKDGKDLVVYGGANFVFDLIEKNRIDELNIFVNPAAFGTESTHKGLNGVQRGRK